MWTSSTRVTAIIEDVASSVVMPSFRSLRPEDIHSKDTPGDPDDLVTIVDKAAERYLIEALATSFRAQHSSAKRPCVRTRRCSTRCRRRAPAWLIDPIDGTKNFAHGNADFGVMLALVEGGHHARLMDGRPRRPTVGYIVVAERGRGTHIDGVRIELGIARCHRFRAAPSTRE